MRANRAAIIVVLALTVLFGCGVLRLFNLRFAAGDVYPPYSSLRTDPLGCKALYEGIGSLPGYTVTRNYRPLAKLLDDNHRTIFFFGVSDTDVTNVPESEATEIKQLLLAGNRIVMTFYPVWMKDKTTTNKVIHPTRKTLNKQKDEENQEENKDDNLVSLETLWGFKLAHAEAATNALWHTTLYFDHLQQEWEPVVSRGQYPAIIERTLGAGTLVLCADSYFVSNEALRRSREPDLIARLIGPQHAVVFDEVHLGVTETPGVTTLARRYGLHGLAVGLLALAILFVWQNACSFLPPLREDERPVVAAGRDSGAGFVNLLRRSIPAPQVLAVCLEEWRKSCAHTLRRPGHKLERIEAVVHAQNALPSRQRHPVEGYRTIAGILKEKS